MKFLFIFFISILFSISNYAQKEALVQQLNQKEADLNNLKNKKESLLSDIEQIKLAIVKEDLKTTGLPKINEGELVIQHSAMMLCYDDKNEQAKWVAHIILPDIIEGNTSRTNDFRVDSLIKTGSATKDDYWFSGYDRGHLAPSADFRWSKKALSESYYYSNMSPQKPELNRERWAELEGKLRAYVINNKEKLYVVTGGVLKGEMEKIGPDKVSVPKYFYKVALDYEGDNKKAIGFIMPNKSCQYPVESYAVSVDSVEALTGIDFFANLPDDEEKKLEASSNFKSWLSAKEQNDVLPLDSSKLPAGALNTIQAKAHIGQKGVVCGTVVSTKLSDKSGATFINLDKQFPNQVFSITIWKDNRVNFSYKPEIDLKNKKVCVRGQIEDYKSVPAMYLSNEKQVQILDDDEEDPIIPLNE